MDFEDRHITDFKAWKETGISPFGQGPCLEVDGKPIAQTGAIARYCGKLSGHYPKVISLKIEGCESESPQSLLCTSEIVAKVKRLHINCAISITIITFITDLTFSRSYLQFSIHLYFVIPQDDDFAAAKVDEIIDTATDMTVAMGATMVMEDAEAKKTARAALVADDGKLTKYFVALDKILKDNGSTGFFVGKEG